MLQLGATQIEKTVTQTCLFAHAAGFFGMGRHLERQSRRGVQNLNVIAQNLNLPRGQFRILVAFGTGADFAGYP